jgi:hypothetical protein
MQLSFHDESEDDDVEYESSAKGITTSWPENRTRLWLLIVAGGAGIVLSVIRK